MTQPQQPQNLTDEFRVRVQLDEFSSATIVSNDQRKLEQHIRRFLPQANLSRESNIMWLSYTDESGMKHRTVISEYQTTNEQSVSNFNQLRKQASERVAA